jgi:hypothetical protein
LLHIDIVVRSWYYAATLSPPILIAWLLMFTYVIVLSTLHASNRIFPSSNLLVHLEGPTPRSISATLGPVAV